MIPLLYLRVIKENAFYRAKVKFVMSRSKVTNITNIIKNLEG